MAQGPLNAKAGASAGGLQIGWVNVPKLIKESLITAALAAVLFLPFIALHATSSGAGLFIEQRWETWGWSVLTVFIGRIALVIWRDNPSNRLHDALLKSVVMPVGGFFRRNMAFIGLAALILAIVFPITPFSNRYYVDVATTWMIYIMLGWGLNIVVGLAGLLDLGYVAFYAVGAYSYALLSQTFGWSFWVCLPLAGVFAAFFGVVLGFPVLRLRGDYLAIVTLGFGEIIRVVLLNWYTVTNGPDGISGIERPSFFGLDFARTAPEGGETFHQFFGISYSSDHRVIFLFYLILALAVLTNIFTGRIRRLPVGRAWEALREDEIACRSLGINPTNVKLSAFALGAMFGGFAGSFFATRQGFVSPESFTFMESAVILAIVVLGGMGSQIGVVIAAFFLVVLPEVFREFDQFRMFFFGAAMVAVMVWRPRGLLSYRDPTILFEKIKHRLAKQGGKA
ncbi:branched-chain amino acid ABC transporter permease [Rhodospirillum rubrum]|uniref:high-affinity branched-chain amino acid ABC transporter permease LivM n=1 Tax=Rhodospirillum rubrum TaxID=1085 RepID=UPI0019033AD7|nr:high-affinity branched-chain amino acid ABC transporter permease LivM [Rhodospirillum rubrum]MBK1663550.1 branched-chain amino acid ABC transporter permease [Rhodospirillum rubrum]MBK1675649.1 branched-chain amino acid ABC transporter permease [Rhodospirillum rubrum]